MLRVIIVRFTFFFFKQKTAYEMLISDWSSDVFSSDLHQQKHAGIHPRHREGLPRSGVGSYFRRRRRARSEAGEARARFPDFRHRRDLEAHAGRSRWRSEERRLGKECVSKLRSRWSQYHYNNKTLNKY